MAPAIGRAWMTPAKVADVGDAGVMDVHTSCTDSTGAPLMVAPPSLLRLWVHNLDLDDGGVPIIGERRAVEDREQAEGFCDHVRSDTRTLPIIALVPSPGSNYYGVDPGHLEGVPLPTIVFHGDRDRTVHPANGAAVLAQALSKKAGSANDSREQAAPPIQMSGGREVTLLRHARRDRLPDAEMWIVHGGGHAWTGGSSKVSYTDEAGPDASREMLRFFLKQSRPPVRERKVA